MVTAPLNLEPGTLIDGRYRIEDEIGAGGVGVVYRARQLSLGKRVAVKVLQPSRDDSASLSLRFLREAKLTGGISSRNVVRVFDYGTHRGHAYCVMECLRGVDLSRHLEQAGRLPWWKVRDILCQTIRGLLAAYELGVLHRDIKPSNIFLAQARRGQPPRVKVLDFGLAKALDPESSLAENLTEPGIVMGTVRYMAPERAKGMPASVRSEIYSLGVIAFECLSGQSPQPGRRPLEILRQRLREPAPSVRALVPDLPPELDALIHKLMERDPDSRVASLEELRAAMMAIPESPEAPAPARTPRAWRAWLTDAFAKPEVERPTLAYGSGSDGLDPFVRRERGRLRKGSVPRGSSRA